MTRAPRAAGALALAVVVAAAVGVALAAATGADGYLVPPLVRAQAPWMLGPLAGLALRTPIYTVFGEVALMAIAYAAAVVLAPRVRLWWVAAAVVAVHVVVLLAPPLLSNDVLNYVDVARLAGRYHLDPYVSPPAAASHDPLYVFLHWRNVVTDYGPLFTLGVRPLGTLSAASALWTLKAVAAVASLGCTALVAWIAVRTGRPAGRAAAAFGLNPVVLVYAVGGAHNDLLMLLALLGGVALMLAARPARGGALLVMAAAIKLSAGVALPFLLIGAPRRRRVLLGMAAAGLAVALLAYVAFPDHAGGMLNELRRQQRLVDIGSVPRGLAYTFGVQHVLPLERMLLHVALAVWLAACLVRVLRGGDPLATSGWALLGVVATSTWLLPWYLVWPLAFAAAAGNWRLLVAVNALALSYVAGHVPVS